MYVHVLPETWYISDVSKAVHDWLCVYFLRCLLLVPSVHVMSSFFWIKICLYVYLEHVYFRFWLIISWCGHCFLRFDWYISSLENAWYHHHYFPASNQICIIGSRNWRSGFKVGRIVEYVHIFMTCPFEHNYYSIHFLTRTLFELFWWNSTQIIDTPRCRMQGARTITLSHLLPFGHGKNQL